jgi:hypothetical protein
VNSIALAVVAASFSVLAARDARAETVDFDTAHTLFYEAPTRSHMFVYTPGVDLAVKPTDWLGVNAGYEADVVSGASVAVKAGPAYAATHPGADVITAASVHDVRHQGRGGFSLTHGNTTYAGGYAYSTENDYRSHSFFVTAKTDALEHDTEFELGYAKNLDQVCDRTQSPNVTPSRAFALEDSVGCFVKSNDLRTRRDVNVDAFEGSWTQAWTPVFATQLVYTAQIVDGFQSNPYRSVILGEGLKAQEHHPNDRARHAVALRGNYFIRPIRAAVHAGVRGYADSWDIKSITAELELEKYVGDALRVALRGRFYKQSGALFYSDDYSGGDPPLGPKGQYFTGDRELSPFTSVLAGAHASYTFRRDKGPLVWIIESAHVAVSADAVQFFYDQFTLGGEPIGDARAYLLGISGGLIF